jgi:hypothetical protein
MCADACAVQYARQLSRASFTSRCQDSEMRVRAFEGDDAPARRMQQLHAAHVPAHAAGAYQSEFLRVQIQNPSSLSPLWTRTKHSHQRFQCLPRA